MSLYGALFSGVSGLAAQSSAMSAIADNITNVNTIGYKGTSVNFQTLVTKQTSLTTYSAGGAQPKPRANIDIQGLLSATSSSTDLGISGSGFFVVNEAANPGSGNVWGYTRAGSFKLDNQGFLTNVSGYYLQAWPLSTYDGSASASLVRVGDNVYMKAYQDSNGITTYVNDNIIDSRNLKPINLNEIGGTATATQNIRVGANLPADDPVFDASNASAGGRHSLAVLIYDSLGNDHNLNVQYTKQSSNSWGVDVEIPSGAATITTYGNREVATDSGQEDVYAARGQIEFSKIPSYGELLSIDDGHGAAKVFEFTNSGATGTVNGAGNIIVNISTVTSIADVIGDMKTAIDATLRDSDRFVANGAKMDIIQSATGDAITIDASGCLSCLQSQCNANETTGIPTGIYKVEAIDEALKNVARFDFDTAPAVGATMDINGTTFEFTNAGTTGQINGGGNVIVNINGVTDPSVVVSSLKTAIDANLSESGRFVASGRTLNILQSNSGADITYDIALSPTVTATYTSEGASNTLDTGTITNSFTFNTSSQENGYIVPAVRFNSDGTPKYFNVDSVEIQWANGAEDMEETVKNGQNVDLRIDLFLGNTSTADGLTHLSGDFAANYITQDGAKFGNFAGVSIGSDGIVTALFDNGETRPVAQIPLATFVNPNGMEARTGNTWIETDSSGQPTVRTAGSGGAGTINSASLEASTVDLGTEFTYLITTQRAYSASAKVITTSDEMLDELVRIKR
ncbi:flagellar hook-basal body complex protein [Oleispirillum naphthae]|uniref:flagellar hook-basal body complex protein n=1 Tax=Oleispirillum naphthae TaxID=2838853 RepID=UPI00308253BD